MTLHVNYDHQCPQCSALYIPYDRDVPCPKCGNVESEQNDYIKQAADSMRFNKTDGVYTPAAWWVGSLGDHVLKIMFPLFDAYDEESPADFGKFASCRLDQMNWGDQQYLKVNVLGIALRLHDELYGSS